MREEVQSHRQGLLNHDGTIESNAVWRVLTDQLIARFERERLTDISVIDISVTDMKLRNASFSAEVQSLVPLTPAVFYVMLSLASGPKHGYAIMQEATTLSEGSFRMGPATLYSTIQRLVALYLIIETVDEAGEDSRRRYYDLTESGRDLLRAEVTRMNSVLKNATAKLIHGRSEI